MADEKEKVERVEGLVFDLGKITARRVNDFLKAMRAGDLEIQARIMGEACKKIPDSWWTPVLDDGKGEGDPVEKPTHSDLIYDLNWGLFQRVRDHFSADVREAGKN